MPARKQFDPERALDAAVEAFWARGYALTSVDDLVRHMGIHRSSLYATFGDKDALFEAALRRYDQRVRRAELARLKERHPPLEAIRQLFDGWLRRALDDGDRRGCLLANTAAELGAGATPAARLVAETQRDTEAFLLDRVREGQRSGDIPPRLDAARCAGALLALLLGLLVLVRTRPERSLMEGVVDGALSLLGATSGHLVAPPPAGGDR